MNAPVLVVIAGLPATGKTTLARPLARELRAAYLRIDTIETAILRAQDRAELVTGGEGYAVGYDLAADQLALGLDVVAECVNPLSITRDAWRAAASRRGARIVEVELVCSDAAEHRARLQARTPDIDGLRTRSTMTGNDMTVLFPPARDSLPTLPRYAEPLVDATIYALLTVLAPEIGYEIV